MLFDHPACEQCPPRVGEKSLLVAPRHSPGAAEHALRPVEGAGRGRRDVFRATRGATAQA